MSSDWPQENGMKISIPDILLKLELKLFNKSPVLRRSGQGNWERSCERESPDRKINQAAGEFNRFRLQIEKERGRSNSAIEWKFYRFSCHRLGRLRVNKFSCESSSRNLPRWVDGWNWFVCRSTCDDKIIKIQHETKLIFSHSITALAFQD